MPICISYERLDELINIFTCATSIVSGVKAVPGVEVIEALKELRRLKVYIAGQAKKEVFVFTGNNDLETSVYSTMELAIVAHPEEKYCSYWEFSPDRREAWTTGAERITVHMIDNGSP